MENIDKGLTVPNWVLIYWPKIPQMLPKFSAQFVCSSPKVWTFRKKARSGFKNHEIKIFKVNVKKRRKFSHFVFI